MYATFPCPERNQFMRHPCSPVILEQFWVSPFFILSRTAAGTSTVYNNEQIFRIL